MEVIFTATFYITVFSYDIFIFKLKRKYLVKTLKGSGNK